MQKSNRVRHICTGTMWRWGDTVDPRPRIDATCAKDLVLLGPNTQHLEQSLLGTEGKLRVSTPLRQAFKGRMGWTKKYLRLMGTKWKSL